MDNKCLVDRILNTFLPSQVVFAAPLTVDALQVIFLLLSILSFLCLWSTWLFQGNSARLPVATVLFYAIKMLSDVSMSLESPDCVIFSPILSRSYFLSSDTLFLSNVDPWVANALFTFIFAFLLENKLLRILQSLLALLTLLWVLSVLVIYQLSFSFAINSAFLTVFFAFVFSFDVNSFYEKWNDGIKNKPVQISDVKMFRVGVSGFSNPGFEKIEITSQKINKLVK